MTADQLQLVRMAAASVALAFIRPRHLVVQVVLAVVAAALAWKEPWWGGVVVVVMLIVLVAYLVVARIIRWLGGPKELRAVMSAAQDEIRAEYERLDLPIGPIASARFAYRLARGKRPHAELAADLPEAVRNIRRILDTATSRT